MIRGALLGSSLCGKTTLAKSISREYWNLFRMRTFVLDVHGTNWGPHAMVFTDRDQFLAVIWRVKNALIIIDDGSITINRNNDLAGLFTMLRHQGHKLLVIGHRHTNMDPQMRAQIDQLYIFRQGVKSANSLAEDYANQELMKTCELQQHEFINFRMFGTTKKQKLSEQYVKQLRAQLNIK